MKPTADPPRLLSAGSEALRSMLRSARNETPPPELSDSLAKRLGPILDPPPQGGGTEPSAGPAPDSPATGGTATGTAAAGSAGLGSKLGVAAAVAMVAAGGALLWPDAGPPASAPPTCSTTLGAAVSAVENDTIEPVLVPSSARAIASALAPETRAPSARAASAQTAPALAASVAPANGEDEVTLLRNAQDALGPSPQRALRLTAEHAARYPSGAMSQEREVIAISALLALGRTADARARVRRFAVLYPRSAHRQRLEALLKKSRSKPR